MSFLKHTLIVAITFVIVFFIMFNLISCKGISNKGTMRKLSDIRSDIYAYLDSEAIALAESSEDSNLRAEAIKAGNLVNDEREKEGLEPLEWDVNLETVASVRAKECSEKFSHIRPNGSEWYTVNSKIQGGENLAYGYDNAEECVEAWMDSPTHKDNILYDEFTKGAISIYEDEENEVYYWSEQFNY